MKNIFINWRKQRDVVLNDKIHYVIPYQAISDTQRILKDYADFVPSHEGLVYWGGIKEDDTITIKLVVAPETESGPGHVKTSHRSNFEFIEILNSYSLVQIAQVHSHPTDWVGHSLGDDEYAACKVKGLLSIVVPEYCMEGFNLLRNSGVHRFQNKQFVRLHSAYLKGHFEITHGIKSGFKDLRR